MKKYILLALLLMVATLQTALAQGFRVYKSDGTVAQFSLRTDSIVFYDGLGSDVDFGPFTPVNQMIVGTWYKSKTESVTFNEDGTTNYIEDATYKFLPYQGTIIIYNISAAPVCVLKVHDLTAESMILGTHDNNFSVLTRAKPMILVSEIVLSETSLSLQPDEMRTLTATVLPENADNLAVTWESSNRDVAEVNDKGRIVTNGIGSCIITCRATDGSGVYAECSVSVQDVQLVTGITLNQTSLSLTLPTNKTQTLTATVQPANATDKSVTWSSSSTSVATVDQTGKVTAVAAGSCTITASAADGSGVKAECAVTVTQLVTGITLSQTSLSLTLPSNTTHTLTATVNPSNATNKNVTWSSSSTSIATVDQTGKVTAVSDGTCTITCTAKDGSGVKATCAVTVEDNTHGYIDGHEWVDLGLPSGTKWATCNIGASSTEQYGNYYAWGATSTNSNYSWSIYKYSYGSATTLTKYCWLSQYGYNRFTDGLYTLQSTDDAATENWGGKWQMPSDTQWRELINVSYTTKEWTKQNNVSGYLITSKTNGRSVFLPAAGKNEPSLTNVGYDGRYWSRSLAYEVDLPSCAYFLSFDSSSISIRNTYRCYGYSVRPVVKQ